MVFGFGREFYPFQLLGINEGTGVSTTAYTGTVRDELYTDSLQLFLEIKIFEIFHTFSVEYIAEIAEAFDMDALTLGHTGVHHACDVAQHGLHVTVAYGGDLRQVFGDGFRPYGFSLYDGLGVIDARPLAECFFPKWHSCCVF